MTVQQVQSDCDREQAILDSKNAACDQEALKQLNDQLQAQIATFLRTQVQTSQEMNLQKGRLDSTCLSRI